MTKKSLLFGVAARSIAPAIALLLFLFAFAGCSNPASEGGTVTYGVEGLEVNTSELRAILADGTPGTYALVSNNTTTGILGTPGYDFIPVGVTLNLYGSFTIGTSHLTVGGNLNITRAATLIATAATNELRIGYAETENNARGTVTVRKDGRLTIGTSAAVRFANKAAPAQGTGTLVSLTDQLIINHAISENAGGPSVLHGEADNAQLVLEEDSILSHTAPLATLADATALKNLANAKFVLNLTTAVTSVGNLTIRKGTSVTTSAAFVPTGILTVNGSLTTSGASAINAGLTKVVVGPDGVLTASQAGDTFAAVETLVVNGVFTSTTATFAAVGDLEVEGILTAGNAAIFTALVSARGSGSLTLGTQDFGTKAAILFGIKNVSSAITTITAPAFTVPEGTTLTLTAAAAPVGNVTVNGGLVLTGSAASLTIDKAKALNITGAVSLIDGASVILTADTTTGGAKLTGTGTLTAGNTDIVGGPAATAGWQAVFGTGTTGTIKIQAGATATAPTVATITGSAGNTLNALGPGATITQRAGAGNSLTIAAVTQINLGGATTAGEIILKNSPELTYANAGKITLAAATSIIATGNAGSGSTNTGPLASDPTYSTVGAGPVYTALAVPFLHGNGGATDASAISTVAATLPSVTTAGKLVSLSAGGAGTNVTVIGGDNTSIVDGSHDGKISADTATQPTEPVAP